MPFSFGIGAGKEKSSSRTTGTTKTSGSARTITTEDLTAGDAASKQVLDTLTQLLGTATTNKVNSGSGTAPVAGYTKQDAITDSAQLVSNIFTQFRESTLPDILGAGNATGGYAGTTTQLLANDAFGRATAQGATVVSDMIKNYATISQAQQQINQQENTNFLSSLLSAIGLQQSATKSGTTDQTQDYKETSNYDYTTTSKGSSLGLSLAGGSK